MRETVAISAGSLRAEIVPSLGGGLARFDLFDRESTPVFRPWPQGGTDDPNRLACYVLVPWSNRISGGGFRFRERFYRLEPNFGAEPFPIHGNGWTSAWQVTEAAASHVSLKLVSDGPAPFRYDASLAYSLDVSTLTVSLSVTSRADTPLPYGLGLHPWLPRTEATTLQALAGIVWLEDSRHLPTSSAPVQSREDWDFSLPQMLPPGWVNNAFTGWNGRATIKWHDRGLALDVEASEGLDTYLLYSPNRHADFFCFEPMSHLVDAHNLPGGPAANGLVVLAPGEELSVRCRFSPHESFEDDRQSRLSP